MQAGSSSSKKKAAAKGGQKAAGKRDLKKRDTDEAVDRMIKTNFAGWDSASTDVVERDGKCLRATLADARRESVACGGRVSTKFIQEQKDKFRPEPESKVLEIPDGAPAARPALLEALAKAVSLNPYTKNRGPLMAMLQTGMQVNIREAIGLIRTVADLNPHSSPETRSFIMAVLQFFYQTTQSTTYKPQLLSQRSLWDTTLQAVLAHHRKHRLGQRSFVTTYAEVFDVLSPTLPDDARAIVNANGNTELVRTEIVRAHASSGLGEALFAEARAEVSVQDFAAVCRTKFELVEKDQQGGEDAVKSAQASQSSFPKT